MTDTIEAYIEHIPANVFSRLDMLFFFPLNIFSLSLFIEYHDGSKDLKKYTKAKRNLRNEETIFAGSQSLNTLWC